MPKIERAGVELAYSVTPGPEPSLLFVHGFLGNRGHFGAQVGHFSGRFRCIAVDLRGHGRSDAPQCDYGIEDLGDDLAFLIDSLALDRPVVIGHSLGGLVVADYASRFPRQTRGVVVLDAPVIPRPELVEDLVGWSDVIADDYLASVTATGDSLFGPYDDFERKQRIQAENFAPEHTFRALAKSMSSFVRANVGERGDQLVRSWEAPAFFIEASDMNDLPRLRVLSPEVLVAHTLGAGHYLMHEVPQQVNAFLDRALRIIAFIESSRP
jgi:pimeloyl-ACP methyl ester carboxylesterase